MPYSIAIMKMITRVFVQAHRDWIFLFGDNVTRQGQGGQAKEMRGEENCIGIVTKYAPHMFANAFMTDMRFDYNCHMIAKDFEVIEKIIEKRGWIRQDTLIILPEDGLGTGLARLEGKAPQTWEFLQGCLKRLKEGAEYVWMMNNEGKILPEVRFQSIDMEIK